MHIWILPISYPKPDLHKTAYNKFGENNKLSSRNENMEVWQTDNCQKLSKFAH